MKKLLGALFALLISTAALAVPPVQVTLTWTAPTAYTNGNPITGAVTYNVYQGLSGALVKVASGLSTATDTITAGLTAGTTQCFAVTAVVATIESAQTPPVCATISTLTPNAPVSLSVTLAYVVPSASGTILPPATQLIDSSGGIWTVSNAQVYLNGSLAGNTSNVLELVYFNGGIYQENTAKAWWLWNGTSWVGSTNPI